MMVTTRLFTLLGCALLAAPMGALAQDAPPVTGSSPLASLRQLDEGFVYLFNKVAPSVVVIDATKKKPRGDENESFDFFQAPDEESKPRPFRMPEPPDRSEGSGIIIRADGYILTNQHVIEGAEKVSVRLKDGRKFPAKVIGNDSRTDVAVIKIEATELPSAVLGDSDALRIGQVVCAIGVPFALDYSFTVGVVSGKGRAGFTQLTYEDYIQTDASINPGNSGGPLFDIEGRVVGMNTIINGIGRGLAFAIPSNFLRDISGQLIATGRIRRPWLGIRIETLTEESSLREQVKGIDKGVVINTIEPDAPAYRSDLRPADVITAIDGVAVTTSRELQKQVLTKKVGQNITLTVWRAGKPVHIVVPTGELPEPTGSETPAPPLPSETPQEGVGPEGSYGLQIEDATGVAGARIVKIEPGSPAAVSDLQPGDLITEIDSKPVENAAAASKIFAHRDSRKAVLLFLQRNGQKTYAVLKIEK